MKSVYQIFLAIAVGVCSANVANSQEAAAIDSSYLNSHYENRLAYFRAMPNQKKEIVFLGNSLTEGGKWQELINKRHVVNRGISGDVTYGIYARLDEVIESKPAKLFLLSGTNDMKRDIPNEVIAKSIERIIARVKRESPKTKIYLQSLLPVNEAMLPKSYAAINNAKVNQLNVLLENMAKGMDVNYIDLHPALADETGNLKKELAIDGLHLRQASYILWANYLKKLKVL
jgi:lysophospholipase L1-like esterase